MNFHTNDKFRVNFDSISDSNVIKDIKSLKNRNFPLLPGRSYYSFS